MKKIIFPAVIIILSISYGIIGCKKSSNPNNNGNITVDTSENYTAEDTSSHGIMFPFIEDSINSLVGLKRTYDPSHFLTMPVPQQQGVFGTCVAWAVCYGFMSEEQLRLSGLSAYSGLDQIFSPLYIYDKLWDGGYDIVVGRDGTSHSISHGISIEEALQMIQQQGCCLWSYWPYMSPDLKSIGNPSPDAAANASQHELIRVFQFKEYDKNVVKAVLSKNMPIVISVWISQDFKINGQSKFTVGADGSYIWKSLTSPVGTHAMVICGYDDSKNAFEVLNSWGSQWGNNGFIWIDYDFLANVLRKDNDNGLPMMYTGVIGNNLPILTTAPISSISQTTAISGGIITSGGSSPIDHKGVCWSLNPNPTIADHFTDDGAGAVNFSSSITSLLPNITYHVRAYASNNSGFSYGDEQIFTTTNVNLPAIATAAITSITQSSAVTGGNITNDGGSPVTARGICYATHSNPIITDNPTPPATGTTSFTCNITGLLQGVKYFVKAYATNSSGTSYGNEQSFTTVANPLNNTSWRGFGVCPGGGGNTNTITLTITTEGTNATGTIAFDGYGGGGPIFGTCNSSGTSITWTSGDFGSLVPVVWPTTFSVSGTTMTGVFGYASGAPVICQDPLYTLTKQ